MSNVPTQEAIIGKFINGRNSTQDFLQLADNHGGNVFGWIDAQGILQGSLADNSGVTSVNGIPGAVEIIAGTNINILTSGNDITISATGGNTPVFSGPSPWYDITYYGARALTSFQTTTATTSSPSSTAVTVTSAIDFQPGDGLVLWKAGAAAATTAAPSAPTVSCAAVTGSSTFNYLCVAADEFGGLSANSTKTQITNAPTVFGSLPVAISSISQTTNVVTVNTSSPINAVTGQQVTIVGVTPSSLNGTYAVASAPTTSQFTYALSGNVGSGTVTASTTARLSNTYNITAITRTGTTISITTNAAHNFNAQASGGSHNYKATIAVVQGVDQPTNASGTADLNGQYVVLTASGTSLTLQSAIDYGASTETGLLTGTGQWQPTVTVYEYITVTCPTPAYPEPFAYYVYADYTNSGTYALVGRTLPYQSVFVDYGPWQNQDFGAPAYVPTSITLPGGFATQNQLYSGKIQNINSNVFTVTPAVPTQVSGVTAMHDNTVAITAAMTAAAAVTDGTIYIPPSAGSFILNAPLKMLANSYFNVLVGSKLVVNESIMNISAGYMSWKAAPGISGAGGVTQFGQDAPVPIVGLANPMLFSYNGPLQIQGLAFSGTHSCGQVYVNTLGGGGENFSAVDCTFAVGGSTGPTATGTTIPVILQAGSGYQAVPHFTNCTFIGYSYGIGNGGNANGNINLGPNIPLLSLRADEYNNVAPSGLIMDGNNTFAGRGIMFDGSFGQFTAQAQISIHENESPCTPTLMIWGQSSGGGQIKISNLTNDSQPGAIVANWAVFSAAPGVIIENCQMSGTSGMVTGSSIPGLVVISCTSPIGQNENFQSVKIGQGSAGNLTGVLQQAMPIVMYGPLNPGIFWPFSAVGMMASASGGGTIAAGTYSLYVTAVGWNGNESLPSSAATATVNGSQGIATSWTAIPGVQGYNVYLFGGIATSPIRQNNSLITTNSFTFTVVSNDGAVPGVNTTGLPLLDNTGLTTPVFRLTDPVKQGVAVQYFTQTITLSAAQLLALEATPIQILAAPGSGLMYVIQSVSAQYRYLTTAFTLNSATKLTLGFTSAPITYPVAQVTLTGFVDQTHSVITQAAFTNSNNASADVINAALYASNDTANLSLGAGSVTLVISYSIVNSAST